MKNIKLIIIYQISKPANKPTNKQTKKKKQTHAIGITKTEVNKPKY